MANDKESVPSNSKKRVRKPKNYIEEISFMISILGIKRRAKMTGITYDLDDTKLAGIGTVKWETFTYTIGEDSDYIVYDEEIKANNRNVFVAIYKAVREKNNAKRSKR